MNELHFLILISIKTSLKIKEKADIIVLFIIIF